MLAASVCFQRNGGSNTELLLWAKHNTTDLGNVGAYVDSDNRRTPVSGSWIRKVNAGDKLYVSATSVSGNIWTNNNYSTIFVVKLI